ncbi:hypothetical protein TTHERM_00137840 (macronuclear) [Tetrahymena thermophila SB210]|uniref:Uncharacterized protein n=1 Tax=Tetrahymena thermophila (strain SB210) TaxID=312017 RepID=I7LVQ5_TETTS|nr:hypothetical protein TTHERM_00137840 [Tetrahymena thermophila SB210]EAR99521.2 hypothetical protein TTHERM_00137840 [Tetrahymena thermophila SB210]|eukprot:XP_001019766.2 hypothetical protein TTHERM_00137840 [Tetrahymena thermophila SB210]
MDQQYNSKNDQRQWIKLVENSILISKSTHKKFQPISGRDEVEAISIEYQNYIIENIEKESKYLKIINQISKQLDIKNTKSNGTSTAQINQNPLQIDFEQQLLQIQFVTKDLYDQIILLNKKIDYMEIQLNSKEPKYLRSTFNSSNGIDALNVDMNSISEQIKRLAKFLDLEPRISISSSREDLTSLLDQIEMKVRDIKDVNNQRLESFAIIQSSIQSLNEMCQEIQKAEYISIPLINQFSVLNENMQQLLEIQVKNSSNPRQYASMFNIIQKQSLNLSNTLKNAINASIYENKEVIQMRNEELLEELKAKSKEITSMQIMIREYSNKILNDLQILLKNSKQESSICQLIESIQNQIHDLKQRVLIITNQEANNIQDQSEKLILLEAENSVLNQKYEGYVEIVKQLEEKIFYLNMQVDSLKDLILKIEKENEQLKNENDVLVREKELFKQDMELNLENIINTKNQFEIIMETDKQNLYQRIDELRQEVIQLQNQKEAKEKECQELLETIDDLEEFSKKQLAHIKNFQDQNQELLARIAQFDNKVNSLAEEINEYKKIIERQQKDMERMQNDVSKLVTTCEQQQEEIVKQKQTTQQYQSQLSDQMRKFEDLNQKLSVSQQESEKIKQKNNEQEEKYQKMQQLLSITQNELKNARQNSEKQQTKQNEIEDLRGLIDSLQNDIKTATLNQQLFEEQRNQKLKENQLLKEQNQQLQQEVLTMREQISQTKRLSISSSIGENKQHLIIESLKCQIKYKDQQFEKERAMFRQEEDAKIKKIQLLENLIKQLQAGQEVNGLQVHEEPINGNTANFNSSLNMYYENLLETKDLEISHLRNLIKQFTLENTN